MNFLHQAFLIKALPIFACWMMSASSAYAEESNSFFTNLFLSEQSKVCIESTKRDLSSKPGWLRTLAIEQAKTRSLGRGKIKGQPGVHVTGLLDVVGTFEVPQSVADCYAQQTAVSLGQKPENTFTPQCRKMLTQVLMETKYFTDDLGFRPSAGANQRASQGAIQFACAFADEDTTKIQRINISRAPTETKK